MPHFADYGDQPNSDEVAQHAPTCTATGATAAAVKPAINVGTIGHAGSGKTTLIAALGKLIAAQHDKNN